jgi:hypothetical protein
MYLLSRESDTMREFRFSDLLSADSIAHALYEVLPETKSVARHPLVPVMDAGNQGSFPLAASDYPKTKLA